MTCGDFMERIAEMSHGGPWKEVHGLPLGERLLVLWDVEGWDVTLGIRFPKMRGVFEALHLGSGARRRVRLNLSQDGDWQVLRQELKKAAEAVESK